MNREEIRKQNELKMKKDKEKEENRRK